MNIKNYISTLLSLLIMTYTSLVQAQNPKWFKKAIKAQVNITTFDKDGKTLRSGSGFLMNEQGEGVADYTLFKEAHSAKAITSDGDALDVMTINGASSLYDVVRFQVKSDKKKLNALKPATLPGVNKEQVWVMPFPTKEKQVAVMDTLENIQNIEDTHQYYTLGRLWDASFLNVPIMNNEGEVLGVMQRGATQQAQKSYALGISFISSLEIKGLSAADNDLNSIHITKALPKDENEARTYVYMIAYRTDSAQYVDYVEKYIEQFPKSADGYLMHANFYSTRKNYVEAEKSIQKALSLSGQKDEVLYSFSKMVYELNRQPGYKIYKDWDMQKAHDLALAAFESKALPIYINQQAQVLYSLKKYELAAERFLYLQTTNMRAPENFLYAAQCLRMTQKDTLRVLALQDSAIACYTKPYLKEAAPALLERSNTLIDLGKYRQAVMDLNEYEKIMYASVNANFYYRREQVELKARMFQQALNDIDKAIQLAPEESLFLAEKAALCYRVNQNEAAIEAAQKAIALQPDYADAHRILGLALKATGKDTEAKSSLEKAAQLGDEAAKDMLQ